jgi:hypothetical protein
MKKEYITPEIETIQLKIHGMLAASPPPGWNGEVGAPEFDSDVADFFANDDLWQE